MTDPVTGLPIPDTGYFEYGAYVGTQWIRSKAVGTDFTIVTASDVPNPRPPKLIVVKGIPGGGAQNIILAHRRLLIHCFDISEALVCRMAEMVRGYMVDGMYTRGSGFRGVDVVGEPYFFPDPADPAKTPRAQLTVDIQLRARFTPYGTGS